MNEPGFGYLTVIHVAVGQGDTAMVKLLLDYGANPLAQNDRLITPAMLAASIGQSETLRVLTTSGVDIEMADYRGQTILHLAAGRSTMRSLLHVMTATTGYKLESENAWGAGSTDQTIIKS